jgi:hypothetical protein
LILWTRACQIQSPYPDQNSLLVKTSPFS